MPRKHATDPAKTGAPPPPSAFASQALTLSDAGIVREVTRRLAAKDGDPPVLADATVSAPRQPAGGRLETFDALRQATQRVALTEWNSVGPALRRPWDLYILIHYSPAPLDVDALLYLSEKQRESLRERATKDRRYVTLERQALKLMREMVGWVTRAKKTLAGKHRDDGLIGPGMAALEQMLDPAGDLVAAHGRFSGRASQLARSDRERTL
jgi:hypothetical protein